MLQSMYSEFYFSDLSLTTTSPWKQAQLSVSLNNTLMKYPDVAEHLTSSLPDSQFLQWTCY